MHLRRSSAKTAVSSAGSGHPGAGRNDGRILIVAPLGHDAAAMASFLEENGFQTLKCRTTEECAVEFAAGAGVILLTEEALELAQLSLLVDVLNRQASWSEVPLIILTGGGPSHLVVLLDQVAAAAGAVTLLERPLSQHTLLRSIEVALRSRRRQYQVRDLVTELATLNKTLERRVAERTAEAIERAEKLRLLSAEVLRAEDNERRRISQVLHDEVQQLLMAARLHLKVLCETSRTAKWDSVAQDLAQILTQCFEATRSLSLELAPPVLHESGLAAALRWLGKQTEKRFGIAVAINAEDSANPEATELRIFLYRAVRELLLNVVKHADGSAVRVTLQRSTTRRVRLTVIDDGPGFDPARTLGKESDITSLGLFKIQEGVTALGGKLEIDSAPGRGTRVQITVPFDPRVISGALGSGDKGIP